MKFTLYIAALVVLVAEAQLRGEGEGEVSLQDAWAIGANNSKYREALPTTPRDKAPEANLEHFRKEIRPLLEQACVQCHGPDKKKAKFRVDTLDPNLLTGADVSWWLEVVDVLSNAEMPPADEEVELKDVDRAKIIDWLTREIQVASQVRRSEGGHTSFRRLTRYEYNYALQDLLGLPYEFANDLPPETTSEDGFKNSSEMLQMTSKQFELYREIARSALEKATVRGERPAEMYFGINLAEQAEKQHEEQSKSKGATKKSNVRETSPHYRNWKTDEPIASHRYNLRGRPIESSEEQPETPPPSRSGIVIPGGGKAVWNLGSELPETGNLRVRVRASRNPQHEGSPPRLRLLYGFQASNNSHANYEMGGRDHSVEARPGHEQFYEWIVPLGEIDRNPFRGKKIRKVNSTESFLLHNPSGDPKSRVQIDYIEVSTPAYDAWPPRSHRRIFPDDSGLDEKASARRVISTFMRRSWRRLVTEEEIDRKVALYERIRPGARDHQDAVLEVLSAVLGSPHFLYLVQSSDPDQFEVATRLSMFLWSSVPDGDLLALAKEGKLDSAAAIGAQAQRMLKDPRSQRFSRHFVRQWLGMDLLDYLKVDPKVYRSFDEELKEAMKEEPIAFFAELLRDDLSVMNFLHADFAMVNERLAKHYGISEKFTAGGFQRVSLEGGRRGGLLTQAGLLAMNSDGKDSHPLKRGIWLLERVLNDPPPPPPPSVPEIDLADPEIAKLTLKERIEDHRNDAACMSCHARIDPWGIAFENFDAIGAWRDQIAGNPVDANSVLFNKQELRGIEGLKRFLLLNRQDQFAQALVHKLSSYALGRPITFADRAELDTMTSSLRREGDGLATLVSLIVTSDLFLQN